MPRRRYLDHLPSAPPLRLTPTELRQRLAAWPSGELAELVVDLVGFDDALWQRVSRLVVAREAPAESGDALRAHITQMLAVLDVPWNAVSAYVLELEAALVEVKALGRAHPLAALDVAWHFFATLPNVFDAVQGEDELQVFANELAAELVALTRQAGQPPAETFRRLLAAFLNDTHGNFGHIPEALTDACADAGERAALAAAASDLAAGEKGGAKRELEALAAALNAPLEPRADTARAR